MGRWKDGWSDVGRKKKQGQGYVAAWLGRVGGNIPSFRASISGSKASVDGGETGGLPVAG